MNAADMARAMRAIGIPDDKIVDTLIEAEEERLAKQRARTAKYRNNKKTGNVTRVTNVTKKEGFSPEGSPSPRSPQPLLTPLSQERTTPLSPPTGAHSPQGVNGTDPDFENLWSAWKAWKTPKGSKKSARSEWDRHVRKAGLDPGPIIAAVAPYCKQCERTDTNTQHIERWIKKHRWEDELLETENGNGTGKKRSSAQAHFDAFAAISRRF